jgi:hypothetical protein
MSRQVVCALTALEVVGRHGIYVRRRFGKSFFGLRMVRCAARCFSYAAKPSRNAYVHGRRRLLTNVIRTEAG